MIIFQDMYRRVEIFQLLVRRKLLRLKCPCGVSMKVNVAFGTLNSWITSNNLPGWPTIYERFYCLPVVNRMESFRGDRANPKIKRNSLNPLRLGLVLRHDSFSFSFNIRWCGREFHMQILCLESWKSYLFLSYSVLLPICSFYTHVLCSFARVFLIHLGLAFWLQLLTFVFDKLS